MTSRIYLTLFSLIIIVSISCTKNSSQEVVNDFILQKSMQFDDNKTAINTLYQNIYADSNELTNYEELANLYLKDGNYKSALAVCEYYLNLKAKTEIVKIASESAIQLKLIDDAIFYMTDLSKYAEDSIKYQYDLSVLLYQLERDDESIEHALRIVQSPLSKLKNVTVSYNNQIQEIPYYAAAYNTLGALYMRNNRIKEAGVCIEEALRIAPNFELAKANMESFKLIQEKN